jgi:AraC family transcriptional regulator
MRESGFILVNPGGPTHNQRSEARAACVEDQPFHSVLFYLPKTAIDALADQADVPRIGELQYEPGVAISDETLKHLGLSLMPAFRTPDQVCRLFLDYVTLAFASHAAQTYGGMRKLSKPIKGGLAPWQERLSKGVVEEQRPRSLTGRF